MRPLYHKAYTIMYEHRARLSNPRSWEPIFSFDNPSIHRCDEELARIGIDGSNTFPLTPYSPDVHKVIEHVHGYLTQYMRSQIIKRPNCTGRDLCVLRGLLRRRFYKIQPMSVMRDTLYGIFPKKILVKILEKF